ncbi:hypothetical protein PILCRDRAFT_708794 [Piloderma croceum F 1598]|uniref:Uncharacterized protein n=1 Tax=Piloderma croceum (strain F 1598) TaxID=765440 RepID=A0A0C3F2K3_PILCF|nr:hypothetical protein PILCRDRAFT_708794 [Piloderma croceum F 1598]
MVALQPRHWCDIILPDSFCSVLGLAKSLLFLHNQNQLTTTTSAHIALSRLIPTLTGFLPENPINARTKVEIGTVASDRHGVTTTSQQSISLIVLDLTSSLFINMSLPPIPCYVPGNAISFSTARGKKSSPHSWVTTHLVVWNTQGNVHESLRQAPELHLVRVQHTARPLDEPVPDLNISLKRRLKLATSLLRLVMKAWT